ncbi:MAG: hypothetical protein Q4E03_01560 [Trueperella sp.]|nr:hypothetical protein [Trueperella sp.]
MDLVGRRTLALLLTLAVLAVGLTFILPGWYDRIGWALGAAFLGSSFVVGFEIYQHSRGGNSSPGNSQKNDRTNPKKRR